MTIPDTERLKEGSTYELPNGERVIAVYWNPTQEEVNSISAILAQIKGLKQIRETKGYAFR